MIIELLKLLKEPKGKVKATHGGIVLAMLVSIQYTQLQHERRLTTIEVTTRRVAASILPDYDTTNQLAQTYENTPALHTVSH
jgi:hypothetical protein